LEIPRGRGVSRAKIFKGKFEQKLEFQVRRGRGSGNQTKNPSMGGVWIFSGKTQIYHKI